MLRAECDMFLLLFPPLRCMSVASYVLLLPATVYLTKPTSDGFAAASTNQQIHHPAMVSVALATDDAAGASSAVAIATLCPPAATSAEAMATVGGIPSLIYCNGGCLAPWAKVIDGVLQLLWQLPLCVHLHDAILRQTTFAASWMRKQPAQRAHPQVHLMISPPAQALPANEAASP